MVRAMTVLLGLFLFSGAALADGPKCMTDISKAYAEAMKAGDVDKIMGLYLDSVEVLSIESNGKQRRGTQGLRKMYEIGFAEATWTRADFELIRTDVGKTDGFCFFRFIAAGTYKKEGAGSFVLSTQGTWIVRNTKNGWRIVHEHMSARDGIPRLQKIYLEGEEPPDEESPDEDQPDEEQPDEAAPTTTGSYDDETPPPE